VLTSLDFNLTQTTALRFLHRFSHAFGLKGKALLFAFYLTELSVTRTKLAGVRYSLLAASAIYLANKVFKRQEEWPQEMVRLTRVSLLEARVCAKDMYLLLLQSQEAKASKTTAVLRKYAGEKYLKVSLINLEHRF
jgi:transcription initiation factor TFIIIB Brf1 subunit/transcription initiation factor TFIIB